MDDWAVAPVLCTRLRPGCDRTQTLNRVVNQRGELVATCNRLRMVKGRS
jgi:hypothetical protein